ncbi:hypothetical protein EV363DRAFT_1173687 [Boletus edulis]|uniref:Uncharacterized protein n=1 Tax=Boletus edulis BED1 TaxID=1328754 RepID=A0AAD4CAJ6_BOLED|nr:hypothetical protein EV363DRAFT_1173687 [Boletus edulis]KAF8452759.1 hypothetical protein L210DRAFT_2055740 [Boletus edulis BED1]
MARSSTTCLQCYVQWTTRLFRRVMPCRYDRCTSTVTLRHFLHLYVRHQLIGILKLRQTLFPSGPLPDLAFLIVCLCFLVLPKPRQPSNIRFPWQHQLQLRSYSEIAYSIGASHHHRTMETDHASDLISGNASSTHSG